MTNSCMNNTIQYNTIQYNTIQYNTIQYNTIQYNTIQYNKIQYPPLLFLLTFSSQISLSCATISGGSFLGDAVAVVAAAEDRWRFLLVVLLFFLEGGYEKYVNNLQVRDQPSHQHSYTLRYMLQIATDTQSVQYTLPFSCPTMGLR
jgi:hypothetical protein